MSDIDEEQELRAARFVQGALLSEDEVYWRDKQPFLESRGYMLRPRLRPDWVPSWMSAKVEGNITYCEDYIRLPLRIVVVDATRMSDGRLVYIKRLKTDSREAQIALRFSSSEFRKHVDNHCVPVLDFFSDDYDPSISYLVMPFLRRIDSPTFEQVDDIVDVVDQLLKGLLFMHVHGVAHRDCAYKNLLMDGSAMFPDGFHPVMERRAADNLRNFAWHYSRYAVPKPVKYYFVDFGISVYISPEEHPKLVTGYMGLDRDPPELSETVPYDPFKLDIFILGNFFKKSICEHYLNVGFLGPLIKSMTEKDPAARPSAEEALQQWLELRKTNIGLFDRASPLIPRRFRPCHEMDKLTLLQVRIRMFKRFMYWTARFIRLIR